jgi:uncharacterized protein
MVPLQAASADRPVAPHDRIAAIDVLRGIALFGVLAINVTTEFRVSIFERFLPAPPPASWLDRTIDAILMVGIDSKVFALFSFLFGVGLAIQFDHLAASPRRLVLLVRRLCVLLALGLIHLTLIWNGDILAEYALAGLVVLPFLFASKLLLAAAAAVGLDQYVFGSLSPLFPSLPGPAWMAQHVTDAMHVYGSGGFLDILRFRVQEVPAILPLHVNVFPRTLALMLLGVLAWRVGLFRGDAGIGRILPRAAVLGVALGGAMAIAVAGRWLSIGPIIGIMERMSTVLLACGYGAAVIWAVDHTSAARWLAWAAPLGRMALSNYLTQSVVFGLIFYGYGLGLLGRLGIAAAFAIGLGVYVLQAVLSSCWLRRYRFGPMEWLWRTGTYATIQPLRHA